MKHFTISRVANLGANAIQGAFETYQAQFKIITHRANWRFVTRDWYGVQSDAAERLDVYKKRVKRVVAEIRELLEDHIQDKLVWASMKAVYSGLIATRDNRELAETFFNSVTRQVFTTVGVDPLIEFVDTDFDTPSSSTDNTLCRIYPKATSTFALIRTILTDYEFDVAYEDKLRDVQGIASAIDSQLQSIGASPVIDRIEMVTSVFFRGKGAYLVGRIFSGNHFFPLILSLLHIEEGVYVDAVLLTEDEAGILFSFARSYFRIEVERPHELVRFLKTLMPLKRRAELYISIGYNSHGKTELFRSLVRHLENTEDHFQIARGEKGMVMVVFTMPSFDVVFKIIKDKFAYPKNTTRQEVMAQYRMVFQHDRAGRLIDAQEFEHLKFDRKRFSDELLAELQRDTAKTVEIKEDYVIIKHAYVERRVIPLNLYIREADEASAQAAVIDCGNVIKDLAAINIFPGDMLLKNFGVTRHGRVVFYDYDELCWLASCNFRKMPEAQSYDEEVSTRPWYPVGENDTFPEEFKYFIGLQGTLRQVFMKHHSDLFEVEYWQQIQARVLQGELLDILPYQQTRRLSRV
ncbi:MAG: bifunctional isocitrate dehydrogenase kinase/phosphatase [Chloroflexota bacterium]|nr:bifunctional isocitrate dehydrogenase kinase/phosphatase [Chloroflexota bacterium]